MHDGHGVLGRRAVLHGRFAHVCRDGRRSGAILEQSYDAAGQLVEQLDATAESTVYAYDVAGQLVSVTDPLDRETTLDYTDDGLLETVTLPDASMQSFAYDNAGNLTSFTDADGLTTVYQYDPAERLFKTTRPGGLVTQVTFDSAGRPFIAALPDGTTLRHYYDAAGQLIEIDPSVSGAPDQTFAYDDAGRLVETVDETGTSSFSYDAAGRLTSQTDGGGQTIAYAYDDLGRLVTLTYPDDSDVAYAYDDASQLLSVTDWNDDESSFTWDDDGLLATRTDPNGVTVAYDHDANGRITELVATLSAADVLELAYGYDEAGQLVLRDTDGTAMTSTVDEFEYDLLGQLADTSNGDWAASPGGQLLEDADGSTYAYNAAQQLTSRAPPTGPSTTYAYDGNGARTSATTGAATTSYTYSPHGALTSVSDGTTTVSYETDAQGLRQSRTVAGSTDEFAWAVAGSVPLLLHDGDYRYLYGPGITPIAQFDSSGDAEYLYGDLVGSTRLIVNDDGTAVSTVSYDDYGQPTSTTGPSSSRIGFTGQWTDPTTGLIHLRARDYDPATGQFLTVDPKVDETRQPYAYAANNPLQFDLFTVPWSPSIGLRLEDLSPGGEEQCVSA